MSIATIFTSPLPRLSARSTTVYATIVAVSFTAGSSAPTPLYRVYQEVFGLSPLTVTVVFASYVFAILVAFLTVGKLSDHVGRRPMILAALALNSAALVLFLLAEGAGDLVLARSVQGFATGIALTTLGATIVDTDPRNGATLNGVTAFVGLTAGTLLSGALISLAPFPTRLVYFVLLAVSLAEIAILTLVPETTVSKPGALSALVPRVRVPATARETMLRTMPLNLSGWALGGFYLSLMPSLVATAAPAKSAFVGAAVVSALMSTASAATLALRATPQERLLRIGGFGLITGISITLIAIEAGSAAGMILGTVIAGFGFGSSYTGILRSLLSLAEAHERAGLLAAYFVASYLSFALPAIIAGTLAPLYGLVPTGLGYGAALVALIVSSLAFQVGRPRERLPRIG